MTFSIWCFPSSEANTCRLIISFSFTGITEVLGVLTGQPAQGQGDAYTYTHSMPRLRTACPPCTAPHLLALLPAPRLLGGDRAHTTPSTPLLALASLLAPAPAFAARPGQGQEGRKQIPGLSFWDSPRARHTAWSGRFAETVQMRQVPE